MTKDIRERLMDRANKVLDELEQMESEIGRVSASNRSDYAALLSAATSAYAASRSTDVLAPNDGWTGSNYSSATVNDPPHGAKPGYRITIAVLEDASSLLASGRTETFNVAIDTEVTLDDMKKRLKEAAFSPFEKP